MGEVRHGARGSDVLPRLLLVEDDPYDQELELHRLASHGLSFQAVAVAGDLAEYLARLDDFAPDIIVADYRLPGLVGEEALALARSRCPDVPVVFISGTLGEDRAVELLKQGASDYVLKDRPSRLGPAVERSLAEAGQRRRLTLEREDALQQLRHSRERLQAIVDTVQDALSFFETVRDDDGGIVDFAWVYANPITAGMLDTDPQSLVGRRLLEVFPGLTGSRVFSDYVEVVEHGGPLFHIVPGFDRLSGVFEGRAARLGDGLVTSYRDVTERERAAVRLAASEERFRLAFEEALTGMALVDVTADHGRFQRVNRALCEFLGHSDQDLLALRLDDVTAPEDDDRLTEAVDDLLSGRLSSYRGEYRYRHASGDQLWGLLSISLVADGLSGPPYALAAVEDITLRKQAEQQLAFRALHDDLTGLPNRALLLDHLQAALARAHRGGTVVGVLFVDLDDFKSVNESFGHDVGDEFLARVGERIAGCLRDTDTAARIGGDEFVVVAADLSDPADVSAVAHRIQAALAADIQLQEHRISVPASIGVAVSTSRSTPENLLRAADAAMYRAKTQGGRRWEPADLTAQAAAVRVLALEGELREALAEDQFRVHYQPIFELATMRLVGVEALLRWEHPTRGLLLPQAFLDVAERRGLMAEIGSWVLRVAADQASAWVRRHGDGAPTVAVNISASQLGGKGLTAQVLREVSRVGLTPGRLCLEVTETEFVSAGSSEAADLRALAECGIALAVDDFGAGFAGFDYLRRLPVDTLKIDKSFVQGLGSDETDTAIVASLVALGRSLRLTVVAEGIETQQQADRLRDLGCDRGQGFLWHRALPPEEIDRLLEGGDGA